MKWTRSRSIALALGCGVWAGQIAQAQELSLFQRLVATLLPDPRCVAPPKYEFNKSSAGQLSLGVALASIVKSAEIKLEDGRTTQSVFESHKDNPAALVAAINVYYTTCLLVVGSDHPPERKAEILSTTFNNIIRQLPPAPAEKKSQQEHNVVPLVFVSTGPAGSAVSRGETSAALDRLTAALPEKIAWQRRWFRRDSDGSALTGGGCYHVIVASPKGERAAELELARHNLLYPGIYFELWEKPGNPHYAVTAGIGLDRGEVGQLMKALRSKGLGPKDAFPWKWPGPAAGTCTPT